MIQRLAKQVYEVMYKYEKHFSEHGVKANLEKWLENKETLITLLRNHPNWDEDALAVIFPLVEIREIERYTVNEKRNQLIELSSGLELSHRNDFMEALNAATEDYCVSPSDERIEVIKAKGGIQCVTGQKASRIIGKLCRQFGVDSHPQYNRVFAQLADALNPSQTEVKALLSVHPCDYLEMSSKSSSWSSCHGLEHGSYQAGCLSYLTDRDTMMFYTVDRDISAEYFKAPRRSRQVFCYANGILLQSRLYPHTSHNDAILKNRNLVQSIITTCLDVPDKWVIKNRDRSSNLYMTVPGSKHYQDYEHGYGVVTVLKNHEIHDEDRLQIGSSSTCVCCGRTFSSSGSIKCGCNNMVVCHECGKTVRAETARYVDDFWLCHACLHICACCGNPARDDYFSIFNGRGEVIHVCGNCRQNIISACEGCSIRDLCGSIYGSRFCPRTADQVAARQAA